MKNMQKDTLELKAVSYTHLDGAFTKFMEVSLFGQGEEVAEEALFLTKFAKKIRIFVNASRCV